MAANDELSDEFIAHAVNVDRFSAGVRARVIYHLEKVEDEIRGMLLASEVASTPNPLKSKRLKNLLTEVEETLSNAYGDTEEELQNELIELAELEQQAVITIGKRVFDYEIFSSALTPTQLKRIATDPIVRGSPMSYWWKKQSRRSLDMFRENLRLGLSLGESTDEIVSRVLGKRLGYKTVTMADGTKKRIGVYGGGAINVTRREAEALVRTAIATVASNTQQEVFEENDDVLKGVQMKATLDTRTSPFCRGIDGGAWDFKGNPLPESSVQKPFPGYPPYHFRCRTVPIPVTKSWEELSEGRLKGIREFSKGTRASMDGQVAEDLTYENWFKQQVEKRGDAWGEDILGKGRFSLWKQGKLGMQDMVDFTGRPLTLTELRAKL